MSESNEEVYTIPDYMRMHPSMCYGKLGDGTEYFDCIYLMLQAIIDNSIDEFKMGFGDRIEVAVDYMQQARCACVIMGVVRRSKNWRIALLRMMEEECILQISRWIMRFLGQALQRSLHCLRAFWYSWSVMENMEGLRFATGRRFRMIWGNAAQARRTGCSSAGRQTQLYFPRSPSSRNTSSAESRNVLRRIPGEVLS